MLNQGDPVDGDDAERSLGSSQSGEPPGTTTGPHDDDGTDAPDAEGAHLVVVIYQAGDPRDADSMLSPSLADHLIGDIEKLCGSGAALIDIWLESGGGSPDAAYRVGSVCRLCSRRLRVVVPSYAKSAATLLSLPADEIYMGLGAELGPLDVQIQHSDDEFRRVSALDVVNGLEHLVDIAVFTARIHGADVWRTVRVSRSDSVRVMLDFAAAFMQPLVSKLDPTLLHEAYRQLKVATQYGTRLLCRYGPEGRYSREKAAEITGRLTEDYPTHEFVIDAFEARELGLPVRPAGEYEAWHLAQGLQRQCVAEGRSVVLVRDAEELFKRLRDDGESKEVTEECPPDQMKGESGPLSDSSSVRA